jgi:hypothetical protein
MQRWGSQWPAGFSGGNQSLWLIRSLACAPLACSEFQGGALLRCGFFVCERSFLFWPVTLVSLRNDYPATSQTKIETAEVG